MWRKRATLKMSETWAITLLGLMATIGCGLLAWIASELKQLRERIETMVTKDDCKADMGDHCSQIIALRDQVQKNSERIVMLQAKMGAFHSSVSNIGE